MIDILWVIVETQSLTRSSKLCIIPPAWPRRYGTLVAGPTFLFWQLNSLGLALQKVFLAKRPRFTLSFLAIAAALSLFNHFAFQESFFGLSHKEADVFSFSVLHAFRSFGMTWLSSAFLHVRFGHFAINAVFFLIVGSFLERKTSVFKCLLSAGVIHVLSLLTIIALSDWKVLEPAQYYGMSHIVVGLAAIALLCTRSKLSYSVLFCVLVSLLFTQATAHSFAVHFSAFLIGTAFYFIAKKSFFPPIA